MTTSDRIRGLLPSLAYDSAAAAAAWLAGYWLRFLWEGGGIPAPYLERCLSTLPLIVLVQGAANGYFGLYRIPWRGFGRGDLGRVGRAVAAGAAVAAVGLFLATRMDEVPRSALPTYLLLIAPLLSLPRLLAGRLAARAVARGGEAVLIIGAGATGARLAGELLADPQRRFRPLAFLDDDPATHGRRLHGLPVLGRCDRLPAEARRLGAGAVLLAISEADAAEMERIIALCEENAIPFHTLPRLNGLHADPSW